MALTIYHNPRCSKSRAALVALESRGVPHDVVKYMDEPLTAQQIRSLLVKLKMTPRELIRTKETLYAQLGLGQPGVTDETLIEAMAKHPQLIERPIIVNGNRAVVARPPERLLDIL